MNPNTRRFIDYCGNHRVSRESRDSLRHDFLVNYLVANPAYLGFEAPWYSVRETYFSFSPDGSELLWLGRVLDDEDALQFFFTPDLIIIDSEETPWFGEVKSGGESFRRERLVRKIRRVSKPFGVDKVGCFLYRAKGEVSLLRSKVFDVRSTGFPKRWKERELELPNGFEARRKLFRFSN